MLSATEMAFVSVTHTCIHAHMAVQYTYTPPPAECIAAGDSAGGNLAICSLVYMRERARGFAGVHTAAERPAASKAAAAAAAAETASSSTAAEAAAQAGEFQPPQAAILISPAVDMTDNSTIWSRSPNDELFKYDYVTPGEDSAGKAAVLQHTAAQHRALCAQDRHSSSAQLYLHTAW